MDRVDVALVELSSRGLENDEYDVARQRPGREHMVRVSRVPSVGEYVTSLVEDPGDMNVASFLVRSVNHTDEHTTSTTFEASGVREVVAVCEVFRVKPLRIPDVAR